MYGPSCAGYLSLAPVITRGGWKNAPPPPQDSLAGFVWEPGVDQSQGPAAAPGPRIM